MKTGEGGQARRSGKALLCALALSLVWPAGGGAAVEASEPVRLHLKIASQPLDQALQDFARQSGLQIVFFSRITEGLRAQPLDGDYTVADALTALLADSPLTFRVLNPKTIEIRLRARGRGESQSRASPNSGISGLWHRGSRYLDKRVTKSDGLEQVVVSGSVEKLVATR